MKSLLLFILIIFAVLVSTNPKYWIFIVIIGLLIALAVKQDMEDFEGFDAGLSESIDVSENDELVTADDISILKPNNSPGTYDNVDIIYNLLQSNPQLTDAEGQLTKFDGDTLLCTKAQDVAKKAKESQDNRIRFTSDNMRQYFQEELDEQENRHWFGNNDQLDYKMVKDEINYYLEPY